MDNLSRVDMKRVRICVGIKKFSTFFKKD